tara:strand:+ start:102 stop:812 length:711 start_codon:yes stop_codon:yes gene_type:complete
MNKLKNWDNNTWLSSKNYIDNYCKFIRSKVKINKHTKLLDIGCGRANIISFLHKNIKFYEKPLGVDIVKNNGLKKNVIFKKIDAIKFLEENKDNYDLIIIKQTVHFFSKKQLKKLLNLIKERLNKGGKLLIFSLITKNNQIPCFKKMKKKLEIGLKRDERLLRFINQNLKKVRITNFKYNVNVSKIKYINMLKNRYISCLLNFSKQDLLKGISELNLNYKKRIKFTDTLKCIIYQK